MIYKLKPSFILDHPELRKTTDTERFLLLQNHVQKGSRSVRTVRTREDTSLRTENSCAPRTCTDLGPEPFAADDRGVSGDEGCFLVITDNFTVFLAFVDVEFCLQNWHMQWKGQPIRNYHVCATYSTTRWRQT